MTAIAAGDRFRFALARFAEHVFSAKLDGAPVQDRLAASLEATGERRHLAIPEETSIDAATFHKKYRLQGQPVVLRGFARDWACVGKWSPEYLKTQHGSEPLSVMDNENEGGVFNVEDMTVGQFMDQVAQGDVRKHLRFGNILHRFPELRNDFDMDTLRAYMGKARAGNNMGAFIGAKGTKTHFHAAPPDNLFVQVYGTKRWHLVPSQYDPVIQPVMARSTYYWSDFDPDAPNFETHPGMRFVDYYEFELNPGDVLYNPPSYWHQVTNMTATIGVGFRWLSPMAATLNFSQLALFFLATNPSLFFVMRNKKNYTRVLQQAEKKNRRLFASA